METIKVHFLKNNVYPDNKLELIEGKSDWVDLRCADTTVLMQGEFAMIPLGVAMQLPEGYEAHIAPRSSTFKNYGIIQTNSIGVVDNTYCGANDEWKMPVFAMRQTVIRKGDRICQFRIVKNQPELCFVESDLSDNIDRGGLGSTGVS